MSNLIESARSGDRGDALRDLRDLLAATIATCDSARDVAALSRQLTDVLKQIEELPADREVSASDEIAKRRAARGAGSSGGSRSRRSG